MRLRANDFLPSPYPVQNPAWVALKAGFW